MQQKQYSEFFFSKFGDYFQIKNGNITTIFPFFSFISQNFGQILDPKKKPLLGSSHYLTKIN